MVLLLEYFCYKGKNIIVFEAHGTDLLDLSKCVSNIYLRYYEHRSVDNKVSELCTFLIMTIETIHKSYFVPNSIIIVDPADLLNTLFEQP